MVSTIFANRANDFQHSESTRLPLVASVQVLPLAHGGQNQGSKKTAETDAIFENVWRVNALADAHTQTMRISIDTKASVHVGEYARGGRSRGVVAVKALDGAGLRGGLGPGPHDMCRKETLVPGGILEPVTGRSFLFFGTHYKTSDFMVDGFLLWWEERKQEFSNLKQLVINLDNGPECNGHRSQFLLRMTEFADRTGLCIRLVYYPPYHSKYNAIERYCVFQ